MKHTKILCLLLLLLFGSKIVHSQVFDPVLWWRFECEGPAATPFAGQDYAADGTQHNVNWPGVGTIPWTTQVRRSGPMGGFVNIETDGVLPEWERFSLSAGVAGISNADWPETQNPDGMTVELIGRLNECSGSVVPIYIQDQLAFRISATALYLTYFTECGGPTTQAIPLNRMGRRHSSYYRDNEWHHYAIRYSFDVALQTGEITLYVDGATLPEFTFPLTSRLAYEGIVSFSAGGPAGTGGNRFNMDIDEVAVCDYALDPLLIQQHWVDLQSGTPNYAAITNLTLPIIPPTYTNLQRDPEEFAMGFDPNTPPVSYDPNSMNSFQEQLLRYPVPRYPYMVTAPRNHPFPGEISHLSEKVVIPANTHFQEVVDAIKELHDHFNYTFLLGTMGEAQAYDPNDANPLFCEALIAEAAAPNAYATSITSAWGATRPYLIPNSNPQRFIPHLVRDDLALLSNANDYYMVNALAPFGFISNQPPASIICQTPTPGPLALGWDMNLLPAQLDGQYQWDILQQIETDLNRDVDFILENGEVAPFLMGTNAFNSIINGTTNNCPAGPTMVQDLGTQADYNTLTNWTTPEGYISFRKLGVRSSYRDEMVGPSINNRSFSWYDVAGNSPFQLDPAVDINVMGQMAGNQTGQNSYPTPYFYPARMHTWFDNFLDDKGIRQVVIARQEELDPIHGGAYDYFAPAVSPGYDEGNAHYPASASELDMIRPGQYLGLMKHLSVLGADYFNAFQYNFPVPGRNRPHHSSWWGWQFVSPSYAQASTQRVADLYYNSDLLEGDNGLYFSDGVLGTQQHYRFWGGSPHYLIGARAGTGGHTGEFLISGTIQPSLSENHFEPTFPATQELEGLTSIELIPGTKMTFPIRRQGSMYFYDINPNFSQLGPVFYQLEKWHEYKHPERWSKDIFIEAEVFDNQILPNPNDEYIIETIGNDWGPVNDGQFPYYTSYIRCENLIQTSTPTLEYSFNTREYNDQDDMSIAIRIRNQFPNNGRSVMRFEIVPENDPTHVLWRSDQVIQPNATCWQWYDVGRFQVLVDLLGHDEDYLFRILPQSGNLAFDEIRMVTDLTWLVYNNTNFYDPPTPPTAVANLPVNACDNDALHCSATFSSGTPPWSIEVAVNYSSIGVGMLFNFEHIYDQNFEFDLPTFGPGTATIAINELRDHNCPEGLMVNSLLPVPITAPPTPGIAPAGPIATCETTPPTLTATGGGTYQWLLQGIPIQGATNNTFLAVREGIYSVEVSNGTCQDTSECVLVEFETPEIEFTSGVGNPIHCAPNPISVQLAPNGFVNATWSPQTLNNPIPNFNGGWDFNAPGVYTVTATNGACTATDEVTILGIDILTTPIGYQCAGQDINVLLDDHVTIPGGTWTGTGVVQVGNSWFFNPATISVPGIYSLTYTLQTCSSCGPLNANLSVVVDRCCTAPCRVNDPTYVLEERFDYTCPSTVPFSTSLTQVCGGIGAGRYTFTPFSNGITPLTATDHTGLQGSEFMAAQTFSGGGTTTIYKETVILEEGKNYTFSFWVDNLSTAAWNNVADIEYTIYLPTAINQVVPIASQRPWEEICTTFVSPVSGPVAIAITSAERPDLFWGLDDIRVEVAEPDFTLTGPTYKLCPGSAAFLVHSGLPAGYTISFNPSGGNWFEGDPDTQTWIPNPNPTIGQVTPYTATVTNGTCTSYQTWEVIVQSSCPCKNCPEGIWGEGMEAETQIISLEKGTVVLEVFPNPNSGAFTLRGMVNTAGVVQYSLISLVGQVLVENSFEVENGGFEEKIEMSDLSAGVYYLKVQAEDQVKTFRIVRQ